METTRTGILHAFTMQVHQRMQLANLFQFSSVAKDDTIFSEGDAGDTFYMILKGKVL